MQLQMLTASTPFPFLPLPFFRRIPPLFPPDLFCVSVCAVLFDVLLDLKGSSRGKRILRKICMQVRKRGRAKEHQDSRPTRTPRFPLFSCAYADQEIESNRKSLRSAHDDEGEGEGEREKEAVKKTRTAACYEEMAGREEGGGDPMQTRTAFLARRRRRQ